MGERKIVILITAGLLLLTVVFFYTVRDEAVNYRASISKEVVVEQTWKLPAQLKEISAIAFLDDQTLACVQDEAGTIFVYDLETSQISREISFAGPGDYEGIAVHEKTIFVLRADGLLFRINDYSGTPRVEKFDTPFTAKNDVEGLFFDPVKNKLLISVKERGLNSDDFKGIYEIDPKSMALNENPVYRMNLKEAIFKPRNHKKNKGAFFPSEINRNPQTNEILVLEAREPKLLILDPEGKPKALYRLDRKVFPQPEGLAFDATGKLYISTEGEPGMIHLIHINQN